MAKLLDRLNNKAAVTKLFTSTLLGSFSCKVWGERQREGMKGVGEKKGEREREAERFTHWLPHVTKTSYPQATIPKQRVQVTPARFVLFS